VSVFAPYIILNKSGLPIAVKAYTAYNGGFRHTKCPIESIPAYKEGEIVKTKQKTKQIKIEMSKISNLLFV
jgi:hypothetical protein